MWISEHRLKFSTVIHTIYGRALKIDGLRIQPSHWPCREITVDITKYAMFLIANKANINKMNMYLKITYIYFFILLCVVKINLVLRNVHEGVGVVKIFNTPVKCHWNWLTYGCEIMNNVKLCHTVVFVCIRSGPDKMMCHEQFHLKICFNECAWVLSGLCVSKIV